MKTTYQGTIIEESLVDNRFLNDFKILGVHISNAEKPEERWHLYEVLATLEQLEQLADRLKPTGWYADFRGRDSIVVVFPSKTFEFKYADQATYDEAIAYGQSIGIPLAQLDFKTSRS